MTDQDFAFSISLPELSIPSHLDIFEVIDTFMTHIFRGEMLRLTPLLDSIIEDAEGVLYTRTTPQETRQEIIDNLGPYTRFKDSDKEIINNSACSICLESFKLKEGKRVLPCAHVFHKKCVDRWFLNGRTDCPLCRVNPFSPSHKDS